MIIEKTLGNINEKNIVDKDRVPVLVDHHDLTKPHQKLKTQTGEVFAISLDYGCYLEQGSILYEDDSRVVYVELMPEKCIVVKPEGNIQWARAAFNIGNMHQGAYVHEDCIVVAYDAVLESVIKKLGINYTCEVRKLDGIRANVAQGETHSHNHHHEGD